MTAGMTQTHRIHFSNAKKGKRKLRTGPAPVRDTPAGRVPRVSRLTALAIKFDGLLGSGAVRDQAELAELGHVTRARVTQIMNLLHLAPDIQDELLHLPRVTGGDDPIAERHIRSLAGLADWSQQRRAWGRLRTAAYGTSLGGPGCGPCDGPAGDAAGGPAVR